jgi:hypothetical protein
VSFDIPKLIAGNAKQTGEDWNYIRVVQTRFGLIGDSKDVYFFQYSPDGSFHRNEDVRYFGDLYPAPTWTGRGREYGSSHWTTRLHASNGYSIGQIEMDR